MQRRRVGRLLLLMSQCAFSYWPCEGEAQVAFDSVVTWAGSGASGLFDAMQQDAQFSYPYGICTGGSPNVIYIADGGNNAVRRMANGSVITVVGNGIPGDLDGTGTAARLNRPTGVYYKNGYLYICDNLNHRIKRMDSTGTVVTIAGSGTAGFSDGPALAAQFNEPKSLVVDDGGDVYVADYENHCIRKISNGWVSTLAGTGIAGDGIGAASTAQLFRPRDLCLDSSGALYFVDLGNHKVKYLTPSDSVFLLAGSGIPGAIDGQGPTAAFSTPVAIDWVAPDRMLVLDAVNPRFRLVDLSGHVVTVAGSGYVGYVDGPSAVAAFDLPQDICVDGSGRVLVGDFNNHVIRALLPSQLSTGIVDPATTPLILHPNPASFMATVSWPGPSAPATVELIDARGARVQADVRRFADRVELDVAALPAGLYTVRLSGHALVGTARLVRD